ncbi:MAG: hypothetical protein ABIK43_04550 [candidate division WOR-3 bacterium]
MGRGVLRIPVAILAGAILNSPVLAAESLSLGAEAVAASCYLWRGLILYDRPVLQPSLWLSRGGLGVSVWTSFSAGGRPLRPQADELDLTLDYEAEWRRLVISPSVCCFVYPVAAGKPELELGLELRYPAGTFTFVSRHQVELLTAPGAYFGSLGLQIEQEPVEGLVFSLGLEAGAGSAVFNHANLGLVRAALNCLQAEMALSRSFGWLYVKPQTTLCWLPDKYISLAAGSRFSWSAGVAIGREL